MVSEIEYEEPFARGNTKEKPKAVVKNRDTGEVIPIDGCTEITFRCYTLDFQTLKFSGTKTSGKVAFITDGLDGACDFQPSPTDMDIDPGQYRSEWEFIFADGRKLFKFQFLRIDPVGPTS